MTQPARPLGKMILADGTRYEGRLTGAASRPDFQPVWGEVVFNTSMTGYQEVITDPSYAGQIVVMTYPQIGNYGVTIDDSEKPACAARALVVRDLQQFFSPGPGRMSLEQFMIDQNLPGISGVDSRAITRHIRDKGSIIAAIGGENISDDELLNIARNNSLDRSQRLVERVTGTLNAVHEGSAARAAVIDLGVKKSIVDNVRRLGLTTQVFDASFRAEEILTGGFDFVVVSNGPGDPTDIPQVVDEVKQLIGRIPLLGICLGHQLIALALGAATYKLKFGHHGANQPVLDVHSGRVFITSQNHNYAVSDSIADHLGVQVTYTNAADGTLEGFLDEHRMLECVQFHPEAAPGPHDCNFIFDRFLEHAAQWTQARAGRTGGRSSVSPLQPGGDAHASA
ncbi:MAG TPA: glutamine-hydrolyzing carbamoyl-phosphate synthase small subunit [Candidatus Krumholzibacteria bacterium]|nr:glutamine-hydrolyzing carbamoyl-phosphate synthase small subunit [Candidatus Krumholzibacteria bacterium]